MLMLSILAYLPDADLDESFAGVTVDATELTAVPTLDVLVAALRSGGPSAVLVGLGNETATVLPTIRTLRESFPRLPIIGVVRVPDGIPRLVEAVRAGLDDILISPGGDVSETARRAINARAVRDEDAQVLGLVDRYLSPSSRPIVEAAIGLARSAPTVADLAAALGLKKRTMSRRLLRESLPQASELLAWARCLAAAVMLESERATVDSVARDLRFPAALALRRTMRRLTGLRPSEIRAGGSELVARAFSVHVLRSRAS